jgi:FdhE protein
MDDALRELEDLAGSDPSIATLALLHGEVARASSRADWERGVPALTGGGEPATPLLHNHSLSVDPGLVRELLERLSDLVDGGLKDGIAGALDSGKLDLLGLVELSVEQDLEQLAAAADQAELELPRLAAICQLASAPLLQACRRKAEAILPSFSWEEGYCPVCAAWPALAEVRGVERVRWLRCGRCGGGWSRPHQLCIYCGNREHNTRGYLASDTHRESHQAVTCEKCRGYLKSVASMTPLSPVEVAVRDLRTMELDMAVLQRGYSRPDRPGFALRVAVRPL